MSLHRKSSREATLIDVLDRILDKGIVIDPSARILLVGLDLLTRKARVVVASVETYLTCTDGRTLLRSAS